MLKKTWTVAKQWNENIGLRNERPVEPRKAIWASELGKQDADIFLKMKGEVPSNFPNDRAMRKMDAGNIWEWAIKTVFIKCGLYKPNQTQVSVVRTFPFPIQGADIEVRGKLDFIAGGVFNVEEALAQLEHLLLPEEIKRGIQGVIEGIATKEPIELEELVIEFKSISSFAFDKVERTGRPLAGHGLQLFHYSHNLQKEGRLVYFCRDDARMYEIPILPNDQRLLEKYNEKVMRVSGFYFRNEMPPLEPPIVFDENVGRFSKNFNVEYSNYLTKNYGIKDQADFDDTFGGKVERFNRVLTRIAQGKDMTANNTEALSEMQALGFDSERIRELMATKFKEDTSTDDVAA